MAWHRGQAYGQDLRDRVLSCQGTIHQVAQRFAVSDSYVARVRSRHRRLGEDTPGVQCNHVPLRLARLQQALASEVAQHMPIRRWRSCASGHSASTACGWH